MVHGVETRGLGSRCQMLLNLTNPLNDPPRSLTITLAPSAAKNTAYAFPNPPPAPVTTAVCPLNLNSDMVNLYWNNVGGERN